MRIALYVRVSTSRQQHTHTIDQQLTRLRTFVATQITWSLLEEHIFCDDGYSGAKLKRPGLDHLRDAATHAAFDLVLLTSPDRLARNYVHQMVVLEELAQRGCQVQFLDRPLTDDPHDHVVLQIREAVAEYERTLIAERMRRGRQAKLRTGQLLPWTRAPYGYRLHPERPRDPRLLQIDQVHAAVVEELFATYATGDVSLYKLAVRLTERGVVSPTGQAHWTANTIRLILLNPCYAGMAYSNRIQMRPATARKSPLHPAGRGESWSFRPSDEWVGVPVPAIVGQDVFDRVQTRLATNQQLSMRSTQHPYLLRCLIRCGSCGLLCTGRCRGTNYFYYVCQGRQHPVQSCRDERCRARYIPATQIDELIWKDLCTVLQHPEMVMTALERAHHGDWLPGELHHRRGTLQAAVRSLERQRERLLAAYLAEVIELAEFERRQRELVQQREDVQARERHLQQYADHLMQLRDVIPTVQALGQRLGLGLAQATFEQRRQLVELLIDIVVVRDDVIEIRYVLPTTDASTHVRFCRLRQDYFDPPAPSIPRDGLRSRPGRRRQQIPLRWDYLDPASQQGRRPSVEAGGDQGGSQAATRITTHVDQAPDLAGGEPQLGERPVIAAMGDAPRFRQPDQVGPAVLVAPLKDRTTSKATVTDEHGGEPLCLRLRQQRMQFGEEGQFERRHLRVHRAMLIAVPEQREATSSAREDGLEQAKLPTGGRIDDDGEILSMSGAPGQRKRDERPAQHATVDAFVLSPPPELLIAGGEVLAGEGATRQLREAEGALAEDQFHQQCERGGLLPVQHRPQGLDDGRHGAIPWHTSGLLMGLRALTPSTADVDREEVDPSVSPCYVRGLLIEAAEVAG